jgi:hypothetical protein
MRTKNWLTLALGVLAVVWSGYAGGCGSSVTGTGPVTAETRPPVADTYVSTTVGVITDAASSTSESPGNESPASVSTQAETDAGQSGISQLFAELARELAPLPVYGLAELPPGGSIPAEWWPAVSIDSPSSCDGSTGPNPWVSESPPGAKEAQVLLRLREGWLMIVENFRGDVGDAQGVAVGEVEGRPASLFELPGGTLIQWSDKGAWYGVFGRGVTVEDVIETAHALHLIDALD